MDRRNRPRASRSRSPTNRSTNSQTQTIKDQTNELNRLRAKIMKARLLKSPDLPLLEQQLAKATAPSTPTTSILPSIDQHGKRIQTKEPINEEEMTIQQMAQRERETSVSTLDKQLAKQITRDTRYKNDIEYLDDNFDRLSKSTSKPKTIEQHKQTVIQEHIRAEAQISNCPECFKSIGGLKDDSNDTMRPPDFPIISLGHLAYLYLPNHSPMVDGHCLISPIEHVPGSTLKCSDSVWTEITNFMKCLTAMFAKHNQFPVFMESHLTLDPKHQKHCVIECIPVPLDMSEQVRGYFYEALVNSDEEWSQHRKVIETGPPKYPAGFRARMNPQVPYFHVWLNPKGGLGHVIEDRMRFEPWLGRSVVAGMLDLPPTLYRKPRLLRETREQRISRADEWKSQFDWPKYDWTKML